MSYNLKKSEEVVKIRWKRVNSTTDATYIRGIYKDAKTTSKTKVAGFDMDSTLIKPTNNKKFSSSYDDWEFYDKNVVKNLKQFYKDGYTLVIISNQKGISKGQVTRFTLKKKIQLIAEQIDIPFIILMATHDDLYRKPRTQMWLNYIKCDKQNSFFCGDAGGLLEDFSDTDRKFALNLKIQFIHRNEWLENEDYDWENIIEGINDADTPEDVNYMIDFETIKTGKYNDFDKPKFQELIINVGLPGSGKSFYTNNYIINNDNNHYAYVNQDTLRTQVKCLKECEANLKDGKSVVIDNTNLTPVIRKKYIDLAKQYKVKCRCLYFTASMDLSRHNNILRNVLTNNQTKIIPKIAYFKFRKQFEKPLKKEGFYKIENVDFILDTDKTSWNTFYQYLE